MPDPSTSSAMSTPAKPPSSQPPTRDSAMAYYDKLRKQLRDLLQQKRHQEKQLALYEENIFKAETAYLEETQNGNIVKGFDNYIKGGVTRRRTNLNDADRLFSLSSLTYTAKLQAEDSTPATATSTPSVPDVPRLNTASSKNKKSGKRRKDNEDESASVSEVDTPGPKRVRISSSAQAAS